MPVNGYHLSTHEIIGRSCNKMNRDVKVRSHGGGAADKFGVLKSSYKERQESRNQISKLELDRTLCVQYFSQ